MTGKHVVDAMMDLLLDEDLQTSYISLGGSVNTLPKFVSHPYSMVGSDAVLLGDYLSPRTYGCFLPSWGTTSARRTTSRCRTRSAR